MWDEIFFVKKSILFEILKVIESLAKEIFVWQKLCMTLEECNNILNFLNRNQNAFNE